MMAQRSKPKVMLLVVPGSPMPRMRELQAWLAASFKCLATEIDIVTYSGEPDVPSSLVAKHNVWLYADGAITDITTSLRFARDWAEKWSQPRDAPSSLWYCALKPQYGNRSTRRRV